jgi:hypothetical protein
VQPLDERDRAEVVHRDQQGRVDPGEPGDAGAGHDTVDSVRRQLADAAYRLSATGGGRQVGVHVGAVQVDAEDTVTVTGQASGGGGADPGSGATDDVGVHGADSN